MIITKKTHSAKWHISKSSSTGEALQRSLCEKTLVATYSIEIDEIPEDDTAVCKNCKAALLKGQC